MSELLKDFDEVSSDDTAISKESPEFTPRMSDPTWSDYVMKQFTEDELFKGYPRVDGLRRVTDLLLGPIYDSTVKVITSPTKDDFRATVVCEVLIQFRADDPDKLRRFSDVADVFPGNTDDAFLIHPTAIAATRAEGRALRKALKLKNVVSAEELTDKTLEDAGLNGRITESQIVAINAICNRSDINVIKFINSGKNTYEDIKHVPFAVAQSMIKALSQYQSDPKLIPKNLVGYKANWRG